MWKPKFDCLEDGAMRLIGLDWKDEQLIGHENYQEDEMIDGQLEPHITSRAVISCWMEAYLQLEVTTAACSLQVNNALTEAQFCNSCDSSYETEHTNSILK